MTDECARRQNHRSNFHQLNTNNGRRHRLLVDWDLYELRVAQSLPYGAGARVALNRTKSIPRDGILERDQATGLQSFDCGRN
jgi:hypothetical protein